MEQQTIGLFESKKAWDKWTGGDVVRIGKKAYVVLSARPTAKLNVMLVVNRGKQYYIAAYPDGSIGYPVKVSRR